MSELNMIQQFILDMMDKDDKKREGASRINYEAYRGRNKMGRDILSFIVNAKLVADPSQFDLSVDEEFEQSVVDSVNAYDPFKA